MLLRTLNLQSNQKEKVVKERVSPGSGLNYNTVGTDFNLSLPEMLKYNIL